MGSSCGISAGILGGRSPRFGIMVTAESERGIFM